jgi:glycosyltransferase involved in cell wall biosynthesis
MNTGISVVVSTYNRCSMLRRTLESLLGECSSGIPVEILVVDNNSTDSTGAFVRTLIAEGHSQLRYLSEPRQGVSYARNAGIINARSPIVAFVDDDVHVTPGWLRTINEVFEAHPDLECVGGRILPEWEAEPAPWLTREHWAPLAIQDYGDGPFLVTTENRLCLTSGNLACRRHVFDRIGLWSTATQRIKDGIGSLEDEEFMRRLWQAGAHVMYLPDLVAVTTVPRERLAKRYHRRWHTGHGRFYASLKAEEFEQSGWGRLFDVPAHLYRQAASEALKWLALTASGRPGRAFLHEVRVRFFLGYLAARRQERRTRRAAPNGPSGPRA